MATASRATTGFEPTSTIPVQDSSIPAPHPRCEYYAEGIIPIQTGGGSASN